MNLIRKAYSADFVSRLGNCDSNNYVCQNKREVKLSGSKKKRNTKAPKEVEIERLCLLGIDGMGGDQHRCIQWP